jgi:hypothetical protein
MELMDEISFGSEREFRLPARFRQALRLPWSPRRRTAYAALALTCAAAAAAAGFFATHGPGTGRPPGLQVSGVTSVSDWSGCNAVHAYWRNQAEAAAALASLPAGARPGARQVAQASATPPAGPCGG